jgi:hypothetical protein
MPTDERPTSVSGEREIFDWSVDVNCANVVATSAPLCPRGTRSLAAGGAPGASVGIENPVAESVPAERVKLLPTANG